MSEITTEILEDRLEGMGIGSNPFPGLRPFGIDESHLFFGREGQSDEVLLKLSENRFVSVIGASGSGKSSFMYCGVIPILFGGFLTEAGSEWEVIPFRPGGSPIDNLADAILQRDQSYLEADEEERQIKRTITSTLLRSSSNGLVEAVRQMLRIHDRNILILVDQFEELFRFKKSEEITDGNESLGFVNLLLEAIHSKEAPIYVALTMRSDFIGECAQFPELTREINDSHYLIPQMTREQKRAAIEGPVAVGGGKIAPRLTQQLLNDLGDNPDQLPILQHSLMRTWDYYRSHPEDGEAIDINHYDAIGRMAEALSQHANEAFDELTENEKDTCERVFKTLTEKGGDIQGIRRPTRLGEIIKIIQKPRGEVVSVIEKFRAPGRSLLMPPIGFELTDDTVVDISHESLMRIWVRLKNWVEEEGNAVQMYLRLSDAAANYQLGKAGLWRPPDLQLALNWLEEHKPTLEWAQRYNPAFERTMVFLESSRDAYETEQRIKELIQKRTLRRTRVAALVLGIATIVSIGFLVFAIQQKIEADNQKEIAEDNARIASENEKIANEQKALADIQRQKAEESEREALEQKTEAERQKQLALESAEEARRQEALANIQRLKAEENEKIANVQRKKAEENEKIANEQRALAVENEAKAYKLRLLSISQSMAVKSLQVNDTATRGVVAQQSFKFNKENGGSTHNNDVYQALYYALKALKGDDYNKLEGHKDAVRSVAISRKSGELYSAGSDGKILKWNRSGENNTPEVLIENINQVNRAIAISQDGKFLVNVTDNGLIQVFDLSNFSAPPKTLSGHKGYISSASFAPFGSTFFTSGEDSTIRMWDAANGIGSTISRTNSIVHDLTISKNGEYLAGVSEKGQIFLWNKAKGWEQSTIIDSKGKKIYSIDFSHNSNLLAVGDEIGMVKIWNYLEKKSQKTFTGHRGKVIRVKFSPDDKMLASASWDNTIKIWNMDNYNDQPIDLRDHNSWVFSMDFSGDGKQLIAGCSEKLIRIWPTAIDDMSEQVCNKLNRNMSDLEWEQFVASDIPYEFTCNGLPKGEAVKEED